MGRRRRSTRSPGEYFLAALGLALVALVVAIVATSGSCRIRLAPELGIQSTTPTRPPTPAPTP
ncbi:MAG: hypothetical protein ACM3O7_04170 [Acidobacteriota bacterium]